MKRILTRFVLPAGIVLVGLACAGFFFIVAPSADREPPPPKVAVVEVAEVAAADGAAHVDASGTVEAAERVSLTPQVSGRIVSISDRLMPGARFDKGEVLARVESRDYKLALEQQKSAVAAAELEYSLETGRQEIAEREWELLGGDGPKSDLTVRKPHLQTAAASLQAAKSGLEQAELNLSRTALRAPFNAVVIDESLDVGQLVGPNAPVATLVGTDRFWVKVSVPPETLAMLDIPGLNSDNGSPAQVVHRLATGDVTRDGEVIRLLGELEPGTRRAQLLVAIDKPLDLVEGEQLPLMPGAFVDVAIDGRSIPDSFSIPRAAVSNGSDVWVVVDGKLSARTVDVLWGDEDEVIVRGDLQAGDQLVTSPLSFPLEGMPVRIQEGNDELRDLLLKAQSAEDDGEG